MKTANDAVLKWQSRSGTAASDYLAGVKATDKDQAARAIAAKGIMVAGFNEAMNRGALEKGLQKSGKQGWIEGVEQKGAANYGTGVGSDLARARYMSESGKYDSARKAADSLPRGPKASQANIARVLAVVNAQRAVKVGK